MCNFRILALLTALTLFGLTPTRAHATIPVSVDIDYAVPVESGPISEGFGAALHFGPRLDMGILQMTTELGFGAHGFSDVVAYRGVLGTRLGFGALIRPTVYGHLGVGHVDWSTTSDLTHLTLDVGGALDFKVAPVLELGAHLGYNYVFGNGSVGSFGFLAIGGHLTVLLDGDHDGDGDGDGAHDHD
jgi:hypothetical protein